MTDDGNVTFERSSGNVFADLQLDNPKQLQARTDLAHAIISRVGENDWNASQIADRTGLTASEFSLLRRMKLDGFSDDRLTKIVRQLRSRNQP